MGTVCITDISKGHIKMSVIPKNVLYTQTYTQKRILLKQKRFIRNVFT